MNYNAKKYEKIVEKENKEKKYIQRKFKRYTVYQYNLYDNKSR